MSRPGKSKKYSFKDKKNTMMALQLACDKDIVTAAEYSESFYKSDQSAYQER